METKKFEFGEAIRFGWAVTKENFMLFFLILLSMGVLSALSGRVDRMGDGIAITMLGLIVSIFSMFVQLGTTKVTLLLHDKQPAQFSTIFAYGNLFVDYFIASIIYFFVVLLGLILLIIPGIIWAIKYQFILYLVIDKGMKPMEAFRESARMTDGQKGQLFLFGLVIALFNLAGALCLLVGLLFTIPASMMAMAYVYRKLLIPVPMVATNTTVTTPQF